MILLVEGINPEPWTPAKVSVFRGRPKFYKEANLQAFQNAFSELVEEALTLAGHSTPVFEPGTLLTVRFHFWRQTPQFSTGGRRSHRNAADATNLLKAAEDALQGLLYGNDKHNRTVSASVWDVGSEVEPAVMAHVSTWENGIPDLRDWAKEAGEQHGEVWIA